MNIFITAPSLKVPHGGIRIILEWANQLSQWHKVTLHSLAKDHCSWCYISPKVQMSRDGKMAGQDCLIITSPHSIHFAQRADAPKKVFLFMQMLEHLFKPNDKAFQEKCRQFYTHPAPMFLISQWNQAVLQNEFKRKGLCYYTGNGVNTEDFPMEQSGKDGRTVLVEGWESLNPSKDPLHIGPKVAARLRKLGYRIVAFSQSPLYTMPEAVDQYYQRPDGETLNMLYSKATILIKASRYDARSCSPMEAMTKGTVTARAITQGDDDLLHFENCLRCEYNELKLFRIAKQLLENDMLRIRLAANGHNYLKEHSWSKYMKQINEILCA